MKQLKHTFFCIKNCVLDSIFSTFGQQELERSYQGHGNFTEKRIWTIKIFNRSLIREYD